jgi:radical SAM superfamily enzyme YgiQ (UPF0313 family)
MGRPVLFINPNRYRHPPVVPLGVEYLMHALTMHHVPSHVLDLCFSEAPGKSITRALAEYRPSVICVTVRNVDSVLYPDTEFFLPEIRGHIALIRSLTQVPVIIGGSGIWADPEGIHEYLGGDITITGPAEGTLPRLIGEGDLDRCRGRIIRGQALERFRPDRARQLDYAPYAAEGGVAGFETHKGCSSACIYCTERQTRTFFRQEDDVISELRSLVGEGHTDLHLCDSEFNEDHDYALGFLKDLRDSRLGIRWALYLKPGNDSPVMFRLLRATGAYLVTLTVDTFRRGNKYWEDVARMIRLGRENGIRVSIDLLTGFPYEDEDTLRRTVDFFRETEPDEVVTNVFIRLYKNLPVTALVRADEALKRHIIGSGGETELTPAFYNHVEKERLKELLAGDGRFRVAGEERVANYQKAG